METGEKEEKNATLKLGVRLFNDIYTDTVQRRQEPTYKHKFCVPHNNIQAGENKSTMSSLEHIHIWTESKYHQIDQMAHKRWQYHYITTEGLHSWQTWLLLQKTVSYHHNTSALETPHPHPCTERNISTIVCVKTLYQLQHSNEQPHLRFYPAM